MMIELDNAVLDKDKAIVSQALQVPLLANQTKRASGPTLLTQGEETAKFVADFLPNARPVVVSGGIYGNIVLRPGSIWKGDRMLVFSEGHGLSPVYYTIGDKLYRWQTAQFVLEEQIYAISEGAGRALRMVTLAKAEIALLSGFFVPWWGLLGLNVAKMGIFYINHKALVDNAIAKTPTLIQQLLDLYDNNPKLFAVLAKTAAREVLTNLPSGITIQDIAFLLGRVIRGSILLRAAKSTGEVALHEILRVIVITTTIVTSTHLPSISAHALANSARTLRENLAKDRMYISEEEAKMIIHELSSKPDGVGKLQELEQTLKVLTPIMEQLNQALVITR